MLLRARKRRGAAAVEFMAILPVLTTLLLAGIDFGRFGYRYLQVQNAAMAAANYGAMNPYDVTSASERTIWVTQIKTRAQDEMFARSDTTMRTRVVSNVTEYTESPAGSPVVRRVAVVVTYNFTTLVNWPMIPTTVPLKGTAQVRSIR